MKKLLLLAVPTILSFGLMAQNVGIGTNTPASKLDVSGGLTIGATYSGTNSAPANGAIIEGNVGIGTASPAHKLDVQGGYAAIADAVGATNNQTAFVQGSASGVAYFGALGTQRASFGNAENYETLTADGGNVGIGSTAPLSKLSVGGAGNTLYLSYFNQTSTSAGVAAIRAEVAAPTGANHSTAISAYVPSGAGYAHGVVGNASGGGGTAGRAYGVQGLAGGATSGYNYGVYGELLNGSGTGYGAAIYGVDSKGGYTVSPISGTYAGWFDGDVNVNGKLSSSTLAASSAVYTDGSNNLTTNAPTDGILGFWTRSTTYGSVFPTTTTDNLGIGTSNPQARLEVHDASVSSIRLSTNSNTADIKQLAATDDFDFYNNSTWGTQAQGAKIRFFTNNDASTPKMVIQKNGYIGIGASNPSSLLEIGGSNQAIQVDYNGTNNYAGSFRWAGLQFGNNGDNRIVAGRTTAGGQLSIWVNNTNDAADYTVTPDGILAMTIRNDGTVGIGTATPTLSQVQIAGSGDYSAVLRLTNTGTSGADAFLVASNNSWTFGADKLGIGLGNPGSANVKMTIQADGKVGIGTPSPKGMLDVFAGGAGGVSWSSGFNIGDATNYSSLIQDGGVSRWRNFGVGGFQWYNSSGTQVATLSDAGLFEADGGIQFNDGTVQTTAVATANFLGYLSNASTIITNDAGTAIFTTQQNTDAAVFQTLAGGGVKILKAGIITWNYDQDVISSGGNYTYIAASIDGTTVNHTLTAPTGGLWDGAHNGGSYAVSANQVLYLTWGSSVTDITSMDNSTWGALSITWMGAK